jgi:methylenetetrahydrofolate reductase (NADPH)
LFASLVVTIVCNHVDVATRTPSLPVEPRYELLPFGAAEEQAAQLPEPARLTITASPKQGLDHTFEMSVRLRELGHGVTPHLAARMVRDRGHLDALLDRAAAAGIDDIFVIGGDVTEPAGPYAGADQLLDELAEDPRRPASIGIGAYPEGHPLIGDEDLKAALVHKSRYADYLVTQLCFDPKVLLSWLEGIRGEGLSLPAFAGIPGPVDRRRLLDISVRVGVGPSLSFMRKQRGLRRLFRSPVHAAEHLHDALAPHLGDPRWGLAGVHYYTFNELVDTWQWHRDRQQPGATTPSTGRSRLLGRRTLRANDR